MSDEAIHEVLITENEGKEYQVRLSVKEFRGVEYLHLRRYYMDFFGEWKPSNEGISIELDIDSTARLFRGLVEILSLAEAKELLELHFSETLKYLYEQ